MGVCSYLLIGFWYEKTSANNAANKAFIVNRIADAAFILAILFMVQYCNSLDFNDVFILRYNDDDDDDDFNDNVEIIIHNTIININEFIFLKFFYYIFLSKYILSFNMMLLFSDSVRIPRISLSIKLTFLSEGD